MWLNFNLKLVTSIYIVGRNAPYEIQKALGWNAWNVAVIILYIIVSLMVLVVLGIVVFLCLRSYISIYKKRYSCTSVGNIYKWSFSHDIGLLRKYWLNDCAFWNSFILQMDEVIVSATVWVWWVGAKMTPFYYKIIMEVVVVEVSCVIDIYPRFQLYSP